MAEVDIYIVGENVPPEQMTSNHIDDSSLDDADAFTEYLKLFPSESVSRASPTHESMPRWRAALCINKLLAQVNTAYFGRSKLNDGVIGDSRHCPDGKGSSDHCPNISLGSLGVVTAVDITHDTSHGCSAQLLGDAIRASQDKRVKYMIWNKQICSSYPHGDSAAWTWRPYNKHPHDKHIHISVLGDVELFDNDDDWAVPEYVIPA